MNQPSDEALERLYAFLLKTSVPRILEKKKIEIENKGGPQNENQTS